MIPGKILFSENPNADNIRGIRDYGGEIIETLEFIPEMSTSIE